jgi:M6 family metalloprotease-like protein
MTNKQRLLLVAAVTTALSAGAVPAKRGIQVVTQPDGTTLQIQRVGDENQHYTLTADGCVLTQSQDGAYYFAHLDQDGILSSTQVLASDLNVRSAQAKAVAQTLTPELAETAAKAKAKVGAKTRIVRKSIPQNGMGLFTGNFPSKGDIKALVILVRYKDYGFTLSDPKTYFTNLLNKEGFSDYSATGSCRDYFIDASNNQFRPTFDVYGPVTLSQNRSYYGGNDYYGNDKNPEQMIIEACKALDSEINFADYDLDGDGYVDNVYVFYAGKGEASYGTSDTVWPHSWNLSEGNESFKLDGVTIDRYATSNEYGESTPDGIGTFTHEFSHVMGLPDLYDTEYKNACFLTPADWSVLDSGPYNNDSRTPPTYSAYERNAMGWTEPIVLNGGESVSLEAITKSNQCYIVQTSDEKEFFLFENRQQTGWDKYIPGHGMLIWHIKFDQKVWDNNVVNNSKSVQYVDIVEANGTANVTINNSYIANSSDSNYYTCLDKLDAILDGYSWPGTSKKTEFSATTTPAFKMVNGTAMEGVVSNIAENNGVITFNYGGVVAPLETPVASTTEVGADYFVASWNAVPDANDYLLTVSQNDGSGVAIDETADMGSGTTVTLPEGWTSSTTAVYTTKGNYGEAAPSLKLAATGAYIATAKYESDITEFSMWCKGNSTSGSSSFSVQGLVNGEWTVIATSSTSDTAQTYQLTSSDIPAGVKQIRVVYTKNVGNLAVDDVHVAASGNTATVLPDYNAVSTNGATSYRVDKLVEGQTEYFYTVQAIGADSKSVASSVVYVTISGENGVANIVVDAQDSTTAYYNLNGVKVDATRLTPGVYVKIANGKATKVVVK